MNMPTFKRQLKSAIESATNRITKNGSRDKLSGAMASEGYDGGYLAALHDVDLIIRDVSPSDPRGHWEGKGENWCTKTEV